VHERKRQQMRRSCDAEDRHGEPSALVVKALLTAATLHTPIASS